MSNEKAVARDEAIRHNERELDKMGKAINAEVQQIVDECFEAGATVDKDASRG